MNDKDKLELQNKLRPEEGLDSDEFADIEEYNQKVRDHELVSEETQKKVDNENCKVNDPKPICPKCKKGVMRRMRAVFSCSLCNHWQSNPPHNYRSN